MAGRGVMRLNGLQLRHRQSTSNTALKNLTKRWLDLRLAHAQAAARAVESPVHAPVAQLDRALASGAKGHRFKSCRACHSSPG